MKHYSPFPFPLGPAATFNFLSLDTSYRWNHTVSAFLESQHPVLAPGFRGELSISRLEHGVCCRFIEKITPYSCFQECLFFFKDFIYLTEIETASERGNTSRVSGRGRSRLIAEEPDVGLDPITPGSRPELKADT